MEKKAYGALNTNVALTVSMAEMESIRHRLRIFSELRLCNCNDCDNNFITYHTTDIEGLKCPYCGKANSIDKNLSLKLSDCVRCVYRDAQCDKVQDLNLCGMGCLMFRTELGSRLF